jgi:hypothetical protein
MTTERSFGKIIHIEKYDAHEFEKEQLPFTQICNHVINNIQNVTAGFIWIYLQSKPATWVPCKHEIMKRFDISESTYKRHMAYLSHVRLVEYRQARGKDGKLGKNRLVILNGTKFSESGENYRGIIFDTAVQAAPVLDINRSIKKPASGETARPAGDLHINKDINKRKKKEINKEPPISPKGDCVDDLFERFYSHYPRKAGRQDAIKAFKKHKPTEEFVDMLIENINQRMSSTAMWKDKEAQYILHASTYLNKSRWTDEIIQDTQPKNKYPTPDERAAEQQKILEREMKARLERQQEVADTKGGITKLIKGVDLKAMRAQQEAERIELGMSVTEYHEYVIKGKNNGAV